MRFLLINSLFLIAISNCILKAPNITFTQSQTSLEKQMFGEEKEIEKDGWIVTSVKSSNLTTSPWKKKYLNSTDQEIVPVLQSHAILQASIRKFKEQGYLGETISGKLAMNPNPPESSGALSIQDKNDLSKKIQSINDLRNKIYEHYKNDKNITNFFYDSVEQGEYFEKKPGIWDLKK
jgi:hypothetical protein